MGSLLLTGGAPGKRMALPNSRILIHQPTGGFQGQATDIEIHAKEALYLRKRARRDLREPHRRRTTRRSTTTWTATASSPPSEAVEYGLVDRVIDRHELERKPTGFGSD